MIDKLKFTESVQKGYKASGNVITLGAGVFNGEVISDALVTIPLQTLNRHGLVAGATGTGKTKTLQVIAEELSSSGVSVLMMDIKGDLSGLAAEGVLNDRIKSRHDQIGIEWKPGKFPVELLSLSSAPGARLRATVSEFGPVLFSKILGLNDTQSGVVSLVFRYSDDKQLPLLDLKDFRKVLQFLTGEGKNEIKSEYGAIASPTASTILRKLIELEEQGADLFFGEVSFDVEDLVSLDERGNGKVNIIRLNDIQDRPKLFSTFMLCLLAEIYSLFPEEGDMEQPKLVIFIDEAHLVFKEATKALLDQLETIIKLIRSKGVGIIFCTQSPVDIPASVLSQLGLKVQHALRAFTAADRKAIKMVSENYPETEFYKTEELITSLGTGEALVTVLTEKGHPSPLVHAMMRSPRSRMDILSEIELSELVQRSDLVRKYNQVTDRESAYEMLLNKLNSKPVQEEIKEAGGKPGRKEEKSVVTEVIDSTAGRQVVRTIARELTRGLLGVLGIGKRRR